MPRRGERAPSCEGGRAQPIARMALGPVHSSKVSKAPRKKGLTLVDDDDERTLLKSLSSYAQTRYLEWILLNRAPDYSYAAAKEQTLTGGKA
jgi:hypothetical protein